MMPWTTPKTNWTAQDYEDCADWNRQKDNIQHLATEVLPSLYYFPEHTEIADADELTLPTVSLVNTLEGNLAALTAAGLPSPDGWQDPKTWSAGDAPDYTDVNRWEISAWLYDDMAQRIRARHHVAGTIAAGQADILPRRAT